MCRVDQDNKQHVTSAKEWAEKAYDIASVELPPTHPIRLKIALSLAKFYENVRNNLTLFLFTNIPFSACMISNWQQIQPRRHLMIAYLS